jgi:hypothetical protein
MDKKVLILRDEDVYKTGHGETMYGSNKPMYEAHIVIRLYEDGSYKLLKDRYNTSDREIRKLINPVQTNTNLLLVL